MAKAPNGRGTIYKETDAARRTKWRAHKTVTLPDGSSRRVIARGMTQAETLTKLDQKIRRAMQASPSAEKMTLSQYLDKWLAFKATSVKAKTMREYTDTLRLARVTIGHIPLARVKPTHVQDAITAALREGHPAKASNIRRHLGQAFRQAERWELVQASPVRNIQPVKRRPIKRSVWTPEEIERFLDVARGDVHAGYFGIFHTAVFTGMRRGELIALPWSNVTPTSILVDRTEDIRYSEKGHGTPKTAAGHRAIPITRSVYEVIEEATDGHLAFPSLAGTMILPDNLRDKYKRIIQRSGVTNMRFHDLRRTSATLWARAGHSPKMIQYLLGHSTPHMALQIYTDVYEKDISEAALDPAIIFGANNGASE